MNVKKRRKRKRHTPQRKKHSKVAHPTEGKA